MRCTRADRLAVFHGRTHINTQKAWQEVFSMQDNVKQLDVVQVDATVW